MVPYLEPATYETERLRLRQWRNEDKEPFAMLNADPEVREHFPSLLDRASNEAECERIQGRIEQHGWGFWALELKENREFIGFTGLNTPEGLPCSPCVEIGWRLAKPYWGRGYASEAAREALRIGFEQLKLDEIVAFTALSNYRSRAVMERLGMQDAHEEFDHPRVPAGHPVRRHCLYRLTYRDWQSRLT
jgi:RimJ/RimL family protein N-acetyltransferase